MGKEFIRTHHLELTKGELIYLLFRKKECPKCKSNLERKKEYEIRNDLGHRPNRHSIHTPGTDVKVYKYFFVCIQCSSQFPLGVLAKSLKANKKLGEDLKVEKQERGDLE